MSQIIKHATEVKLETQLCWCIHFETSVYDKTSPELAALNNKMVALRYVSEMDYVPKDTKITELTPGFMLIDDYTKALQFYRENDADRLRRWLMKNVPLPWTTQAIGNPRCTMTVIGHEYQVVVS